ncbi:universal stress protein [Natronococcus occultus]|uniref:Universal stress protein UspA-like protein n=1 Tax=Natronococcus occultus SP4 TaxID=694430 RepID=L0JZU2_9EURY|nr:universal stress protein [Natronococcus occultus]AGB37795.1 universal stress protein UspA-like protein [Natronococcus occultus SP4]
MFERILLPTDGSERAERAAPYAVELAERFDATLHPIYVVDTEAISHALGPEQVDRINAGQFAEMTELHERAAAAVDGVREYTPGDVDVDPVIEAGNPRTVITEFAAEQGVDLIVMTSQGRGGVRRALFGSVTEAVARDTDVPVLVVDATDDAVDRAEPEREPA